MPEYTLEQLSNKLDQLITQCEQLHRNNESLQQREQEWLRERTSLIEKNDLARTRVESMITDLKSLKEGVG
ncbi:MAG: cell division protein ZapB [Kiritimatiellia bacterium]|jgi:cell division protein ZapB